MSEDPPGSLAPRPGDAPELLEIGARKELFVTIPAEITFETGKTYQLWLLAKNGRGSSTAGPVQT